jgi:hypothetical protein
MFLGPKLSLDVGEIIEPASSAGSVVPELFDHMTLTILTSKVNIEVS